MVLGLGVGHFKGKDFTSFYSIYIFYDNFVSRVFFYFKGWSERLELQEQYADIREERMEELTDSLVSCMTGNLFKSGFSETHFDVGKYLEVN